MSSSSSSTEKETGRTLTKFLGKRDLEKIPPDILKKVEKFCEGNNEHLVQTKVLYNTTQKNIEKLRKEYEVLVKTTQDSSSKKHCTQVNVTELRNQLDTANAEVARLALQVTKQESETSVYRMERNQLIDEKDQLMKLSDGKDTTINNLQLDMKSLDDRLQLAIAEKCDAITRFAEMTAKEESLDDKDKKMTKKIERLSSDIIVLTESFNKTTSELVSLKENNASAAAQMESDWKQTLEELRIAQLTICQMKESNQLLTNQCDGETVKLREELNESVALIEHCKRELDAKVKLVDLYKSSFEDCQVQTSELTTESTKLKEILQQSTEKCEELESKLKGLQDQHQSELNEKQETIAKLMDEVKVVNGLLKAAETDNAEKVLEKMFPRAAAANRLLKNNSSLTDIYSRFHDALGNVNSLEAECLQLNTNLERLTVKLQETTSEYDRQRVEYKNTLKMNAEMTDKINNFVAEQDCLREKFNETTLKLTVMERENTQLKSVQNDLARQICNLLNKVESPGDELTADQQQFRRMGLSNEDISKQLVTFDNIVELQENNQKLILKVRELSGKVERLEEVNIGLKCYEEKLMYLERRLSDAEQSRQASEDLLAMSLKQKERFKQLYFDVMKYLGKEPVTEELDSSVITGTQSVQSSDGKDKKLSKKEEKLQEEIKELKSLREEYNEYRKDTTINFNILKGEYDTMQRKVSELYSFNSKLQSQVKIDNEKIKSLENDVAIYKKQIQILEDRNQMYDKTISKHELANKTLRDEALNSMLKISAVENRCEYLEQECRRLLEANSNLDFENKAFHRQNITQSILQTNLELMKISTERSDFEGRVQMENQLDDQVRECKTLKRKLDEELSRFREETESLKRQTDGAVQKMTDEQAQADALRMKLTEAREQVESKNQQIKNISEKLHEALTPSKSDNPIAKGNKKIKDLELQVKLKAAENDQLQLELQELRANIQAMAEDKSDVEDELKKVKENYDAWKATLNADLQVALLNENNLKSQVEELQQEIRLQLTNCHMETSDAVTQSNLEAELKEALQKITGNNKELRELRTECLRLKENLQDVESKYAANLLVHSSDLQTLTSRKDELNKCHEQICQLKLAKEEAVEMLKSSQSEWESTNKQLNKSRQELERKVEALEKQNMELLDLIQAQNSKAVPSTSEPLNDSLANNSITNRTLTDEEFKEISSEKLFNVVKYLRREKDIAVAQMDILNFENARLLTELDMQNKRVKDLNVQLSTTKSPVNVSDVPSSIKYEELLRNVETLKAVTDSNICLRSEKEVLESKVNDLAERLAKEKAELQPLQEKNRELSEKNEENKKENNMLRSNVGQLRQKVTDVVERSNKNPEDFKRLQLERESLAKMLTSEKDNLRQVNDELNALKSEKNRLEQDVAAKAKQLETITDECKKQQDELKVFKQTNVKLTMEAIENMAIMSKKEAELKTIQDQLTSSDAQLKDSRNKEMQIRRIAKKYKDSYVELKTKDDEREPSKVDDQASGSSTNRLETETTDELPIKVTALQEEIDQLRKENDNLKKQDENQQLTDARNRIAALTETNRQINQDYQASKSQLQTCEQSRSEHDSVVATLKSQFEARIKELLDQDVVRQENMARLTRENETLNTRVSQLHRQFQQQGSKPSTSSGTIEKTSSDPARTANVKPMATPSVQQSAPVNLRRGGDTPLASIRPMSVQNSRTVAVLPTSQTSNVVIAQGSSTGNVTTALVPPQQQVHTTGNTSTAEAMSSSPTSSHTDYSHTDYMPATSSGSAVVVAVPPMASTSAEEAESLSVNTNESSSTSSQSVLQQQTVALVSPRIEVAPQCISVPSQQVVDQAASTSGSCSSFLTAMSSSHHHASSSNTVTTTQAGGHKRPRDAEGDSSTGVEESSASEKTSPQNKRTRLGEQTFQGVSESGLDVEYQVPTSSQRDQEDDVAVDSEDDDDEGMDDEATADVDEAFDGDNGDTDEIESFGQDEGEGHDIDEDNVPNDNNEVDVDDSSNAPNQSSSGIAASSAVRVNLGEGMEMSALGQETQQIQTISSGSDAGPSGNTWRQLQTPLRQQQQQNLVIQQTYDETGDDSIVPSTPTLYVARRADGFSEAVSSPHPTVPQPSRFTFGDSAGSHIVGRTVATLGSSVEGMDDTRIELNLLEGSGDGGQSSSSSDVNQSAVQQVINVDSADESANNKKTDEPMAGPSSQAHGSQLLAAKKKRKTDDGASTTHGVEDVSGEVESVDGGSDGVSSEGEKTPAVEMIQVEEDREAEASVLPRNTRSRRVYRGRGPNPVIWHQVGRYHQMSHHQQQHGNPHRGSPTRGRGRPRRPYR